MKIRRRSVVPTTTTMALMTLKAALILVSGLRAAIASASAAVAETLPASFEEIGMCYKASVHVGEVAQRVARIDPSLDCIR